MHRLDYSQVSNLRTFSEKKRFKDK